MDKELCKDEIIFELKAEMERLLNSNKAKRDRVSQLQNNLKECQRMIEELKQLVKTHGQEVRGVFLLVYTKEIIGWIFFF